MKTRHFLTLLWLASFVLPLHVHAQSDDPSIRWMARAAGGGGYTFLQVEAPRDGDSPASNGYAGAWDAALGVSLKPWLALHGSGFGSLTPTARVRSEGSNQHGLLFTQAFGVGLTLRADWGGFLSSSVGLGLGGGLNLQGPLVGPAAQILAGWDARVSDALRLGLALQVVAQGQQGLVESTDKVWGSGSGAALLTVTYDPRR